MLKLRQADLFVEHLRVDPIPPVKPVALGHGDWPPNYEGVYAWRVRTLAAFDADPTLLEDAMCFYERHPAEFIMHWMDTYDPRKLGDKWMPFIFFQRQYEMVDFLEDCRLTSRGGLMEKCRDAGATWVSCGYSIWAWLFVPGVAIGWGSRKESLVDTIGEPDSIFEKLRLIIQRLPKYFLPRDFKARDHATRLRLINPANGSIIAGEGGDNIGRGGRKTMYFVDESAHLERAEKVDSALGDNTHCRIDISSVNGLGNVFHRRREAGYDWHYGHDAPKNATLVFVMDWRHHPEKTQEWYDARKEKSIRAGTQHIFAQEVDRDYSAALSGRIISTEHLDACVDAHLKIPYIASMQVPNVYYGALDVADGGDGANDRNALTLRQWIILRHNDEWGDRDPGVTTRKMIDVFKPYKPIIVQYDCVGVGVTVKSEYNRLRDEGLIDDNRYEMVPWSAGASVVNPFLRVDPDDEESPYNNDMFHNFKAQAWWAMRTRVYKTWMAVTTGAVYNPDELISLDSTNPYLHQLKKELSQPTSSNSGSRLRMLVDKAPAGTRSPNIADSAVMAFFPAPDNTGDVLVGTYGSGR